MANSQAPIEGPSEPKKPEDAEAGLPATLERTLTRAVARPQQLAQVRQEIVSYVQQEIQEYYAGPLPHPEHVERFERTLSGSADRIFAMAEKEQSHRHQWEMRELRSSTFIEGLGLFGGIGVALALVIGAVICAIYGERVIGAALVGASAISMVPAIIKGRDWLNSRKTSQTTVPAPQRPQNAVAKKQTRRRNR